ncbi:MAG: peptidylprolyl isomerase [Nitrospirota bacterium]|nr:peptidylprolyl isomerase [Nitrospirota bacterium]
MSELRVTLETTKGAIHIDLYADKCPITVGNFVNLIQRGFYDGLTFHRVIDDFMIQGGCPEGSGRGGPGYKFEDEFSAELRHSSPGILSMANAGKGTNGSQFFITHVPCPWLDGNHTVFGKVVSDGDQTIVNAIATGDKITKATVEGDTSTLMGNAAVAERLPQWNKALDSGFPNLKPAS